MSGSTHEIRPTSPVGAHDSSKTKNSVTHAENGDDGATVHGDVEADGKRDMEERVVVTEEDNKRLCRKADRRILVILTWVYFLQILDKTVFGYGNVWGLSADTNLADGQYSQVGIMNAIAQIAWQPFSAYLIVKVPSRYLMTALVFCWGVSQCCMAAASNYGGLVATRFLLGLFEAGCLPLFGVITAQWYRRSEQPLRVAIWYSTNGLATIFSALLAWAAGHLDNPNFAPWQLIYLLAGLMTVFTAPVIYLVHDSDIASARFYSEYEKKQAFERLRANQTGTGSTEFKLKQVYEVFYDIKTYLWLAMSILLNVGAAVTNIFGPTLIRNFGFDTFTTCLLNMPFGALQTIFILISSYCVYRFQYKSGILALFMLPVIAGLGLLYAEVTGDYRQGPSLAAYYLLSSLFGGNPLIVSWIAGSTAGQTKKSVIMSLYNAGVAVGNIIGPLLFTDSDGPRYIPGVRAVLAIFCALVGVIGLQVINLYMLNKAHQRSRVKAGKPKYIKDTSMSRKYEAYDEGEGEGGVRLGQNADLDLTDLANNEFVYVY